MHRGSRTGLFVLLLGLTTCENIDNFQIQETSTAIIPGKTPLMMVIGDVGFDSLQTIDLTQNQSLKNQGVRKEDIDSVRIVRIRMTITDPSGADFGFLDRLELFVAAPGEERRRIASRGPFPAGESTIELEIDDLNLEPYVTAPEMEITTQASGRAPDQDTTVEATLDLDVDVDVGGALCG